MNRIKGTIIKKLRDKRHELESDANISNDKKLLEEALKISWIIWHFAAFSSQISWLINWNYKLNEFILH